jgi:hypothetical protein
MLILNS